MRKIFFAFILSAIFISNVSAQSRDFSEMSDPKSEINILIRDTILSSSIEPVSILKGNYFAYAKDLDNLTFYFCGQGETKSGNLAFVYNIETTKINGNYDYKFIYWISDANDPFNAATKVALEKFKEYCVNKDESDGVIAMTNTFILYSKEK